MALAGAAVGLVGLGLNLGAGSKAKKAAKKAAREARIIAHMNFTRIMNEAQDEAELGLQLEQRHYWEASQFKGRELTRFSAGGLGVNVDFGSAAAIREETAMLIVRDGAVIRTNAMRNVRRLGEQAQIVQRGGQIQASSILATGRNLSLRSNIQAVESAGQVIGGLSQFFSTPSGD